MTARMGSYHIHTSVCMYTWVFWRFTLSFHNWTHCTCYSTHTVQSVLLFMCAVPSLPSHPFIYHNLATKTSTTRTQHMHMYLHMKRCLQGDHYMHTRAWILLDSCALHHEVELKGLDVRNTAMCSCLYMCLLCLWCLPCHMQMLKWTSVHLGIYMIDGLGPKVVAIFVAKITLNPKA